MFQQTTYPMFPFEGGAIESLTFYFFQAFFMQGSTSLVLMVIAIILSFAGLFYLLARVLRRTFPGLTSCGQCGYAVQGLSTLTCPECGSDFREVGMMSPRQRRSVSVPVFLLLWTLCLPLPAAVMAYVLVGIGPTDEMSQVSGSLSINAPVAFNNVQFWADMDEMASAEGEADIRVLSVDLYDAMFNSAGNLFIDLQASTVRANEYYSANGTLKQPGNRDAQAIDTAGVLAVFEALELDVTNATLRAQAAELADIFKALPDRPDNASSFVAVTIDHIDTSPYRTPKVWFVGTVATGATLLYPAGIIAFLLLTLQRRRAAAKVRSDARRAQSSNLPATSSVADTSEKSGDTKPASPPNTIAAR